ncbi:DEKNAAC102822 [Brettanomyces naardenensis]|uniref:DEKNAAC102822 n=1 Tax=Brettanomyces naardenensis TaxID=13370 RepID=A0A448YLM8_BRENA|nr:DEKNAAC102822 [Brettanomyces naardenensis]
MPYQKIAENLRPLLIKGLPKSKVYKQLAHLNLIANYEGSAYRFNDVSKLELIFKKMNAYGHMGARKFWMNNLRTINFHNPQLPIEVHRVECATKEEQMNCPSVLKVYLKDGQIKSIDCKSKQHQDIMKELVELTKAEKVPEEEIPVLKDEAEK